MQEREQFLCNILDKIDAGMKTKQAGITSQALYDVAATFGNIIMSPTEIDDIMTSHPAIPLIL
jgi:hypothetical protein